MKTLYFDIDGTILLWERYAPKPLLADGQFEAHVRKSGFDRLVCVGNLTGILRMVRETGVEVDELEAIMSFCHGTFVDVEWFRAVTSLVPDSGQRTKHIDFNQDWWYVDDLAEEYFTAAGQRDVLESHRGGRVLITPPNSDGQDIIDWLARSVGR
ncbi:MAG TPA: hypothetical protein VF247_06325 [Candidatus Krumholzibacteria bacterium]